MVAAVDIIGALAALVGILGMLSPDAMRRLDARFRSAAALYAAAAARLVVGVLLLFAAPQCRPDTPWVGWVVRFLGVVGIVAAIVMLLVGPGRLRPIVDWWINRPDSLIRGASLFLLAVGSLLLYAGT
jgi:hypothetical protein